MRRSTTGSRSSGTNPTSACMPTPWALRRGAAAQGHSREAAQSHGARLGLLLGLAGFEVTGDIPDFQARDIEEYATAARTRGDVRSMELRYENAENNVPVAEADYLPYLGVGGGYQWNDPSRPFGTEGDSSAGFGIPALEPL